MRARDLILLTVAAVSTACGPEIKLSSPLTSKSYDTRFRQPIGLFVSPEALAYVASGYIWFVPYRVEFGDALEANASDALGAAFEKVILLDAFPPIGPEAPRVALALEIASSDVSPGWLTFMSSGAVVDLRAMLAIDGIVRERPIDVRGSGSASPGAAGFISVLGSNSVAYDAALQDACEIALGDALEEFVDRSIAVAAMYPR